MDKRIPNTTGSAVTTFVIGEPGRAALEMSLGAPVADTGPADYELSAASVGEVLVQAASTRGLQHRAHGTLRQDAFALGRQAGDRVVAVVCDGVGSLAASDRAATLVSRRLAAEASAGTSWPEAFALANDAVRAEAERLRAGAGDEPHHVYGMATTAVAVTVHRTADEWVGEVAWVGDSSLWHLSDAGDWTLLTRTADEQDEGTFHSTAVTPLPSKNGDCEEQAFRIRGGSLFVMSDGVGNPLRWAGDVRATLANWWRRPPDVFTFAGQVSFARRSHLDDRTVVGIWSA